MASKRDQTMPPEAGVRLPPLDVESTRKVHVRRQGPDRRVVIPTLRVVAGRDMLRYVTLHEQDEVTIGRDESGSLVLSDVSVSRRHARVTCAPDGSVYVEDLRSTNGTAVNGVPVERCQLHPGDHLEIGQVALRLDLLSLEEVEHLQGVLERLEANNRDALTGLLNRNWLDEELPAHLAAAERMGLDYSCLFVDIDHFKAVNDTYGHRVGDDVLVGVARILMVGSRDTDACVRYGGEELLMFLQATGEAAAVDVAERVRRAIEGHDWSRTTPGLRITVSIGVAGLRRKEPVKDWISRADRGLYAAKAAGRNCVRKAPPSA